MDKPVLIEARQASLLYQDGERVVQAVREVSLRVHRGEFIGIEEPSGSGKSSLLYLLSGLKMPTTGTVTYQGRRYTEMSDAERSAIRRTRFGFVFQQPYLLGYLTVLENLLVSAADLRAAEARAWQLLEALDLKQKAHRYPAALSGGERQGSPRFARGTAHRFGSPCEQGEP